MDHLNRNLMRDEDTFLGADSDEFSYEKLKEIRLYSFFSFALWPVLLAVAIFATIFGFIERLFIKPKKMVSKTWKVCLSFIFLPWHLIKLGLEERNFKIVSGLVLLLPLILTTILSIFTIVFPENVTTEILKPPSLYHPLGTNGEGAGIGQLIIIGAGRTYFMSLIATSLVLVIGVWLGKMTFQRRAESIIMGFVQIIETIPILFLLLIILGIFSWWEDMWKASILGSTLASPLRIVVVGLTIGLGFLPRMIRLVRERIKTFVSENFVDGVKAHGIEQNRILWFHIIKKNCLGDIIIVITQIWAAAILIEISLDYLISISSLLGAKIYESWAGMLLTNEVKNALINFLPELNFTHWWLYVFPGFFIISTVIGFYLFGDGLRAFYQRRFTAKRCPTNFDRSLNIVALKIGIVE